VGRTLEAIMDPATFRWDGADRRKAVSPHWAKGVRRHLANPSAVSELARLLDRAGATSATLSAVVTGDRNNIGQVAGSGTVSISQGKTS
jgi:hypothetical protein